MTKAPKLDKLDLAQRTWGLGEAVGEAAVDGIRGPAAALHGQDRHPVGQGELPSRGIESLKYQNASNSVRWATEPLRRGHPFKTQPIEKPSNQVCRGASRPRSLGRPPPGLLRSPAHGAYRASCLGRAGT